MKQSNPAISLSSIILTVLLLGWLGIDLLIEGGMAFNPGMLTSRALPGKPELQGFTSHADFEGECKRCHQPLNSDQALLCMDCHTNVAAEISGSTGVHGGIGNVNSCRLCHPDHRGRDFSPAVAAAQYYNHEKTGFFMIKHQVNYDTSPMRCEVCHTDYLTGSYQINQQACASCHQAHDEKFMQQHMADYGSMTCLDCHNGEDEMADFDHAASQFPLTGKHGSLACTQCHLGPDSHPKFVGLSSTCVNCHAEPDIHIGFFEAQCDTCHTTDGWKPVSLDGQLFDHAVQGKFSLVMHTNQPDANLTCRDCHVADLKSPTAPVCLDCHMKLDTQFMSSHTQQFGPACSSCHDGVDRYSNFDHNNFFVLDGKHLELDCSQCHGADPATAVYRDLGKDCVKCHAEPDIHAGTFGVACQDCHTTTAWQPALLRIHSFPLDHGEQGTLTCDTCHTTTYPEYTCYNCHEHTQEKIIAEHAEEKINPTDLQNCVKCHPVGKKEERD